MSLLDTLKAAREAIDVAMKDHIYSPDDGEAPAPGNKFSEALDKLDAEIAALEPGERDGMGNLVDGTGDLEEEEPELKTWRLSLFYTTRQQVNFDTFEALDQAAAIAHVKANRDRYVEQLVYGDRSNDGDELFELIDDDAEDDVEPTTIDGRDAGEPFAWVATNIVKKLAKLKGQPESIVALEADELVAEAVAACAPEPDQVAEFEAAAKRADKVIADIERQREAEFLADRAKAEG